MIAVKDRQKGTRDKNKNNLIYDYFILSIHQHNNDSHRVTLIHFFFRIYALKGNQSRKSHSIVWIFIWVSHPWLVACDLAPCTRPRLAQGGAVQPLYGRFRACAFDTTWRFHVTCSIPSKFSHLRWVGNCLRSLTLLEVSSKFFTYYEHILYFFQIRAAIKPDGFL